MSLASLYGGSSDTSTPTPVSAPDYVSSVPATVDQPATTTLPGSFSLDFSDPAKSAIGGIGSLTQIPSAIGQIGFDGGLKIADLWNIVTAPARFVGDIGVPGGPAIRDIPGMGLGALGEAAKITSIPAQFLEYQNAKLRLQGLPGITFGASLLPQLGQQEAIPTDIAKRFAAGEDIDALAHELVDRSQGYSSNLTTELLTSVVADPINVLSAGLGAVSKVAKVVEAGGQAAESLNIGQRALGYSYLAATRAGNEAVRSVAKATLGPVSSGIVRAWGVDTYKGFVKAVTAENAVYGDRADQLVGMFNTAMTDAVHARRLGADYSEALRAATTPEEVATKIAAMAENLRRDPTIAGQIEREAEHLLRRTAPQFLEMTDAERHTFAIKALSLALDSNPEAAARILGSRVELGTAQIVDGMRYAKAASELDDLKSSVSISRLGKESAQQVQAGRLTVLAHDTMTTQDAERMLAEVAADPSAVTNWVESKRVLSDRFLGIANPRDADVLAYVKRLVAEGALPSEIGNRVPKLLSAWKAKWADAYRVGYAPEDGWKVILLDDGTVVPTDPFVHFRSISTQIGIRNPLGQLSDSLFWAINQRTIVLASEQRMARMSVREDLGMSPAQTQAIHRQILRESADVGYPPRALAIRALVSPKNPKFPGSRIAEIFSEHLSPSQYERLVEKTQPELLFLRAIEGNAGQVGLSQKLTGAIKTQTFRRAEPLGRLVIGISEGLYPATKFKWNAFFQAQEAIETPFWKFLRGIGAKNAQTETLKAAQELFDHDPNYRWLSEEYHNLFLRKSIPGAAALVADPGIKGRIARLGDIAGAKRDATIAQIVAEHHESFQRAMLKIDPEAWAEAARAAGSTDSRLITEAFVRERQTLLGGSAEAVDAALEAARPAGFITADQETMWQAYKWTMQQAAEAARTTQYFREGRGFLERTLNHPYLGVYPLSYMLKVYAEFARFLLVRPFGLHTPLAGLAALNRVQTAILSDAFADTGVADFVKKNPKFVNFVDQLLPGIPTGTPVNAPLWLRRLTRDAAAGQHREAGKRTKTQDVTPVDVVSALAKQANDAAFSQPLRIVDELTGITDQLGTYLQNALKETQQNVSSATVPR